MPAAPLLRYLFHLLPIWVFLAGILGVVVRADWIRAPAEQLGGGHTEPVVGGLLTIGLGSIDELMLALFLLMQGKADVVPAQITGSILGTALLGPGSPIVVGSWRARAAVLQA